MPGASHRIIVISGLAAALLAGCAHRAPAPVAEAPAPIPPRPVLSTAYDGVTVPPVDADGHYRTINSGLGEEQTIWHVRAALNVAALSCRNPDDNGITPAYNAMLASKKALLGKANKAVEADFRAAGPGWQNVHDRYMTQLYNYFAMPQASAPFCRTADTLAPRAAAMAPADFPAFAATALLELEAPILQVYQTIDAYKVRLADWDAHYGPNAPATQVAAAPAEPQPRAARKGKAPKLEYHLDYEPIDVVLDWSPDGGTAVALR